MAGRHGTHHKRSGQAKKFAALGAATATATALTVTALPLSEPLPDPTNPEVRRVVDAQVDLLAAINQWPDPDQIPDITGGLGTVGYDFAQFVSDLLLRAVVENFNLAALADAAGLDLPSLLGQLVGDPNFLLNEILGGVLGAVPIDLTPVLNTVLGPVLAGLLVPVLDLLGITNEDGEVTLLGLLGLVGLDLSDPLNLANLDIPGLNVITASPIFTALKLLGVDLGWVPSLPNSVADEIDNTPYLGVGSLDLVADLVGRINDVLSENPLLGVTLGPILSGLEAILDNPPIDLPDVVHLRVPVTVGIGMGAFAAGDAYQQVVDNLANQPGGLGPNAQDALLGSFTVLPLILLQNPGRANGGLLARMYPLFRLFGIDTVTPDTEVQHSGGIPLLNTGLSVGGANLIPIKVDGAIEYDILSDFAAWPNPFSLLNNLAAGLLPTYMLRGITLDTVTEQILSQLDDILGPVLGPDPLAINLFLTLPSATLPLLEPLYLAADVVNIVTLGALARMNPFSLVANALAPALTSLVNLGYTDVVFNPETGAYERTLTEAGIPTPFFSFPNVNWSAVPGVVFNQLVAGIQKEFFSGNPTTGTPNVISNLLNILAGGGLGGLLGGAPSGGGLGGGLGGLIGGGLLGGLVGGLEDIVNDVVGGLLGGLLGGLTPQASALRSGLAEASSLPDSGARMLSLGTGDESLGGDELDGTDGEEKDGDVVDDKAPADEEPNEEQPAEEPAQEEEPAAETPPSSGDEQDGTDQDGTDDEDVVDEDVVDEDVVDEDAVDEDVVDEDAADEDAVDEGAADDGAADDEDEGANLKSGNKFGPNDAKQGNDASTTAVGGSAPQQVKADNDSNDDGGADNDGDAGGAAA
ncbi:ATPase [Mycolicibacterium flavescens]|uniref:Uncharacterized protein n=1 Tax=Mycolicibacterium flavescens TaxID=1776 RepID=A0A1E3RF69_MYCFV|nr:hypothetical protein [Mycolicibacterium flavescens]MCV7278758.1 ATPase [Mycolicibacterium flavescens]ODQ88504.1 hypothetical protein BHQ18_18675 [Mycolicibacterium flavescens]